MYDESEDPRYVPPEEMRSIEKELKVGPLVKKKIKKEIKVVKKPAKPKPLVPEWDWRLGDWTDLFDEDAPPPPPEDIEKVLNIKKREVAGLEALLNLHKIKSIIKTRRSDAGCEFKLFRYLPPIPPNC